MRSKERNVQTLREVQEKLAGLDSSAGKLKSPSAARKEVEQLRDALVQVQEYNEQ